MPLCFYRRPTLVPVFANQEKSKVGFCFYEKDEKQKSLLLLFCSIEAAHAQRSSRESSSRERSSRERGSRQGGSRQGGSRESGPTQAPLLTATLSISAVAAIALNSTCEHLCFILFYFVHPLIRCTLGVRKANERLFGGSGNTQKIFLMYSCQLLLCFMSFWLMKGFKGMFSFQIVKETFVHYRAAHFFC